MVTPREQIALPLSVGTGTNPDFDIDDYHVVAVSEAGGALVVCEVHDFCCCFFFFFFFVNPIYRAEMFIYVTRFIG